MLDSFSLGPITRFTSFSENQTLGLLELALANNVAIFAVSNTQAWIIELFLGFGAFNLGKLSLRYLPTMTPAAGHPDPEKREGVYRVMHTTYLRRG